MKKTFLTTCMLRAAMVLLVALLGFTQGAWAKDFISDVMVIGNNNETAFDNLQSSCEAQGCNINKYLQRPERNLSKLMDYARKLRDGKILEQYLQVKL